MRATGNTMGSLLVLLVLSGLLVGLAAGCGGGGDQAGNGEAAKDQGGGGAEDQGGEADKARESEKKIALGTIRAVKADKGRISLEPAAEAQGEEPLAFKLSDDANITLGGEDAGVGDIKGGQQAQIEYVGGNDVSRATSVELFEARGQQQPAGEDENTN